MLIQMQAVKGSIYEICVHLGIQGKEEGGGKGGDFFIYFYEMFSAKLNLYLGMRQSRL